MSDNPLQLLALASNHASPEHFSPSIPLEETQSEVGRTVTHSSLPVIPPASPEKPSLSATSTTMNEVVSPKSISVLKEAKRREWRRSLKDQQILIEYQGNWVAATVIKVTLSTKIFLIRFERDGKTEEVRLYQDYTGVELSQNEKFVWRLVNQAVTGGEENGSSSGGVQLQSAGSLEDKKRKPAASRRRTKPASSSSVSHPQIEAQPLSFVLPGADTLRTSIAAPTAAATLQQHQQLPALFHFSHPMYVGWPLPVGMMAPCHCCHFGSANGSSHVPNAVFGRNQPHFLSLPPVAASISTSPNIPPASGVIFPSSQFSDAFSASSSKKQRPE